MDAFLTLETAGTTILGVDFGTTNSVVTRLSADGTAHTVRHRFGTAELDVVRSVLCFWQDGPTLRHAAGPAGIDAYLDDPLDSRLMMSLKSYLAQRSFSETRVFNRPLSLEGLIGLFLQAVLPPPDPGARLIAGRPVRFAGDAPDDALGETRLRGAFRAAGWSIETALEPEAAGYRFGRTLTAPATVLIGDFGGGTSDFSIIRFEPGSARPVLPLGHAGIGIAGDSFDYRIVDAVISPKLGKGSTYRITGTDLPVPPDYYSQFARWHRLSLMRAPKTMRDIEAVMRTAAHPERLAALLSLIRDELGYALYRAVAGVKAQLSQTETATLDFRHQNFHLHETIARRDFETWIAPDLTRLGATIDQALADAGLAETAIDRVFLTGGTSLVPAVRALFADRFGADAISAGGEFLSVAEGLALIGQNRLASGQAAPDNRP
jgi:hypothetical chaperone protein